MQQEKNILVNRGIPRTPSSSPGYGFSARGVSGPDHSDRAYDAVDYAIDWLIESNDSTEALFKDNIKNIKHITDSELAKTRAAVRAVVPRETDALEVDLRTLKLQLFKARTDFQKQTETANLYYGHDPLTHKTRDPSYKGFELLGRRGGQRRYYNAIAKWNISYAAAFQAKFLAEQIKLLDARLATHNKAIANVKAKAAAAQAKAQAEAKRVAVEKARKAAETETQRVAQEQALRHALAGGAFPVLGAAVAAGPVFTLAGSSLITNPATTSAIQAALRTAIAMAIESTIAVAAPALAGFAALLYPSELGNGDLYALSVPLSELAPSNSDDLYAIAAAQGEVNLPVVIGSRTAGNRTEFVVTGGNSTSAHSKAPVLFATPDPVGNFYRSYSPDAASSSMIWTPIVKPGSTSTSLPAAMPHVTAYNGPTPVAVDGRIDTHPEFDLYSFGGFVTVFPVESGLPPIYTVFNSPYEGATTKGEHSGREFNPEQAGGPILELDWRTATITQEGIDAVKLHIARLDQSDANDVMIERLERIMKGALITTDVDKRFYTHETRELERFRAQGLADNFIPSNGSPEWNNAHTATLEDYKLSSSESLLYSPEALEAGKKQMHQIYKRLLKGEY
ncbi:S-type pyocin domain-containing protein [Pseudomonas halotolerans]|uniref:S-type pyocin domain-containing protein n=1 Tax=Pseudomonas halotolerans TaxID=3143552 RepID=UPI0031D99E59